MKRCSLLLIALAVLCLGVPGQAAAQSARPAAHITSQTTTTLVAGVAGKTVGILSGSVCVDANGSSTGITFQDSNGTNLVGTGVVYVLPAGSCFWFPTRSDPYFNLTASGAGLQIVTTIAAGPVEVYLETVQR